MKMKNTTKLNYNNIDDIVVDGIDHSDYPDFCDAYILSAMYTDPITNEYRALTEDELENLDRDWVYQQVENWIHQIDVNNFLSTFGRFYETILTMKDNNITEAQLLLNNEVKVTSPRSQWFGHIGRVNKVMADGRTLEVKLNPPANHDVVFIDVSLVGEVQEKHINDRFCVNPDQSLGPIANSVVKDTI